MLKREEYHEIKNQIAIAMGMSDLVIRALKKDPPQIDILKLIDRQEKILKALEKIHAVVDRGHALLKEQLSKESAAATEAASPATPATDATSLQSSGRSETPKPVKIGEDPFGNI